MIAAFSPCRANENYLVTGSVARRLQRGYLVGDIVTVVYEIYQAEVVERYDVLGNVWRFREYVGLHEVFPVLAGAEVSSLWEIGLVGVAGAVHVPADVVGVEVCVYHYVHFVGADSLGAHLADEVAGAIFEVGVGAGAHAGVHEDDLALRPDEERAVVELEQPVFENFVLVGRPGLARVVPDEYGGVARRGHHVQNRNYFDVSNLNGICHWEHSPG